MVMENERGQEINVKLLICRPVVVVKIVCFNPNANQHPTPIFSYSSYFSSSRSYSYSYSSIFLH